jgi:hypothetical protein
MLGEGDRVCACGLVDDAFRYYLRRPLLACRAEEGGTLGRTLAVSKRTDAATGRVVYVAMPYGGPGVGQVVCPRADAAERR